MPKSISEGRLPVNPNIRRLNLANTIEPPFAYPLDPTKPPAKGWEKRGKNWYNPKTKESLSPDLDHGLPVGPHYDWRAPNKKWYRWFPDRRVEPK